MNMKKYLTNNFLIAMPRLQGPEFSKTVTYLCQHNEEGALGVVINRLHTMKMGDIFQQLAIKAVRPEIADVTMFVGGPVQTERGFVLHTPVDDWDSTIQINKQLALTTSKDILEAIAVDKGPEKWLVALGYAGWAAGQLEQEMQSNLWLHDEAEAHIIFDETIDQRWELAAHRIGVDISLMTTEPGHS